MKNQIKVHKTFKLALLLIVSIAFSFQLSAKGAELNKKVSKTFKVTASQALELENKFGDVDISTWEQDQVKIDIAILVDQRNEDKAQKVLDQIEIKIKETKDLLSIVTSFGSEGNDLKMDGKNKIEVNYTVKMPASMRLDLENKFGDITIDKLSGPTEIGVQFGTAKIGSLMNTNNDLSFKFCDPVIIDEINGGEIELKFSKMDLGKAGETLEFNSQMSNSKIGVIGKSNMKVSYGSMDLESARGELILKSSMSTINIKELSEGGEMDVQYGKLTVDQLSKEFKSLVIDSKFTPVVINVEEGAAFELDADTKMSNLELPSGYVAKDASEYMNNEYFKGVIGAKGGELPVMKVSNQFGKIQIK